MATALVGLVMLAGAAGAEPRNFSAHDLRTSAPIDWMRLPSGEDLLRYYPAGALQQRIEGRATISCAVDLRGRFHDCRQIGEDPQGLGFGDAAVKMAPLYKLAVRRSAEGEIAPATPVTFEVRFPPPR
ncbi:hypothetical protein [Phenylobacterium sp.]|uniref:hypothetical protein n=1 Tax=Phenylobacterium sp. TaxID=1871053 RepID=UPI0035667350